MGLLGFLPFEALLSSKPKDYANFSSYPYLLNDYQVSYCYSATLFERNERQKNIKMHQKDLVALPFFEGTYEYLEEEYSDFNFDSLVLQLELPLASNQISRKDFSMLPASGKKWSQFLNYGMEIII
ncbi:MAG: hypothetical protein R2769_10425 [Saprospiraceae bacterium]